jgi:hypothetical protein
MSINKRNGTLRNIAPIPCASQALHAQMHHNLDDSGIKRSEALSTFVKAHVAPYQVYLIFEDPTILSKNFINFVSNDLMTMTFERITNVFFMSHDSVVEDILWRL